MKINCCEEEGLELVLNFPHPASSGGVFGWQGSYCGSSPPIPSGALPPFVIQVFEDCIISLAAEARVHPSM